MTKETRKNNKSLWEKSMKLVMNIAKVSAISLAERSLGTRPGPIPPPPPPYFPESRRSQEPESASKPSYVMELPEEIYVIREEGGTNVDGRASDYIRWFHERIRNDSIDASKISPVILPPPPGRVK